MIYYNYYDCVNSSLSNVDRYINNSNEFWDETLHPRFLDIIDETEINNILLDVNNILNFPLQTELVNILSNAIYNYFAPQRYIYIPSTNYQVENMFYASLQIVTVDTFNKFSYKFYDIIEDDFNITNDKNTKGYSNQGQLTSAINNNINQSNSNSNNIKNSNNQSQDNSNNININNELLQNDFNQKIINDTFLSPQDQGVTPTTVNNKGEGVDGVNIPNNSNYTTNTINTNTGDSQLQSTANTNSSQTNNNKVNKSDELNNNNSNTNTINKFNENTTLNNNIDSGEQYKDKHFDKFEQLQNLYDLNNNFIFIEIIKQLQGFIFRKNIELSVNNYTDFTRYE